MKNLNDWLLLKPFQKNINVNKNITECNQFCVLIKNSIALVLLIFRPQLTVLIKFLTKWLCWINFLLSLVHWLSKRLAVPNFPIKASTHRGLIKKTQLFQIFICNILKLCIILLPLHKNPTLLQGTLFFIVMNNTNYPLSSILSLRWSVILKTKDLLNY